MDERLIKVVDDTADAAHELGNQLLMVASENPDLETVVVGQSAIAGLIAMVLAAQGEIMRALKELQDGRTDRPASSEPGGSLDAVVRWEEWLAGSRSHETEENPETETGIDTEDQGENE